MVIIRLLHAWWDTTVRWAVRTAIWIHPIQTAKHTCQLVSVSEISCKQFLCKLWIGISSISISLMKRWSYIAIAPQTKIANSSSSAHWSPSRSSNITDPTDWQQCYGGQEWMTCGSSCTLSCENPESACVDSCLPRCQCPYNMPIWHEGRCISERYCPEKQGESHSMFCCTKREKDNIIRVRLVMKSTKSFHCCPLSFVRRKPV